MKKIKHFYIKNQMIIANGIANLIGVLWVNKVIMFTTDEKIQAKIWGNSVPFWIDILFDPFAFLFITVVTVLYEHPVRQYLNILFRRKFISDDLKFKARQRLLNEPFVLIALDLSMWLLAAIVYPAMHWAYDSGPQIVQSTLHYCLSTV